MRIKWNMRAFEELRRSPGTEEALQEAVSGVLSSVGSGYAGGVEPGATRSRGYVVTASPEAMKTEAESPVLLTALSQRGRLT